MIWFILILVLFLILLLLPLAWAGSWYFRSKESVLPVRQQRTRDPRFFARSFDKKFQEAWKTRRDGVLHMSKDEHYFLTDGQNLSDRDDLSDRILVAWKEDLVLPEKFQTDREIYADKNVVIGPDNQIRAICTKGNMQMRPGSALVRWADADGTIAVYDDCDTGISLTAGKAISIGKNCKFRRLYAPVIHLGAYPGDNTEPLVSRDEHVYENEIGFNRLTKNKHRINSSQLEENGVVEACIVTDSRVTIEEDIVVMGDIHTRKSIHLSRGSVVCGSIFAGKHVYLDRDTTVLGSIFSQGHITMDDGVVIGQRGRICSVIARTNIKTGRDCFVYGYISNEGEGVVCPINEQDRDCQKRPVHKAEFLQWPDPDPVLHFADAEEFERIDSQGFRNIDSVQKAVIPEGVEKIPESMFFNCRNLKEVALPSSLKEIGQYAFADCVSLVKIDLSNLHNLHTIGLSAFDGCTGLQEVILPDEIKILGPAAFCGCTALEHIGISQKAKIQEIGSHCFMHCPAKDIPKASEKTSETAQEAPADPKPKNSGPAEKGVLTGV